jgi:hypothetical protein
VFLFLPGFPSINLVYKYVLEIVVLGGGLDISLLLCLRLRDWAVVVVVVVVVVVYMI